MKEVKLGIIGIGNMGSIHALSVAEGKIPGLRLTAVADRNPDRLAWANQHLPLDVSSYAEGTDLILSGTCEAVLIATPHYQHPVLAIAAFRSGLHVLSEKPAGVYTLQVKEMNAEADKHPVVFAMMFNQRTNCLYRKVHELVSSGEMGALKRVTWLITDWYRPQRYYDSGQWRATWEGEGGGVLLNQCPHQLDLLQWLCGMPIRVRAFCHEGKWHDIEVEDDVSAYLEFSNGATGVFITSTADAPGTNRLELTLEMGSLIVENGRLVMKKLEQNEREFCRTATGGFDAPSYHESEVLTDGMNEQHNGVLKAFAAAILHGAPLVADGREGIRGLSLSNAMHLSSWLGKEISIPFDEEQFLDLLNEKRKNSRLKDPIIATVFDTRGSY
ncbi:MAG: Gfo/Idh/MocA family oxidoreductase [Sphaerochaeta sp.]